jgi:glycosyltransferase involved in cell wall biosynthesis
MNKKVILCAYACCPNRGSEPGNGWGWSLHLAKLGYQVWSFCNVEFKDIILEEKEKLGLNNLNFVFVELPLGLDKLLLNTNSNKIYLHYYLWQKKAGKLAKKLHGQHQFDIAHHVSFGSVQQGTFLWQLKGVKMIFGPVGGGQKAWPVFKEYFGKSWYTEKIRNYISEKSITSSYNLKQTIQKAEHILVSNMDTFDFVKRTNYSYKNLALVSDTCISDTMVDIPFIERIAQPTFKLLWLGRFTPRKGLKLIFHAISLLPQSFNYTLTIIGEGKQQNLIEGWIDEYKLDRKKLIFVGQLPYPALNDYYTKADVFLFCTLRDSFGSQLLEAMRFSLPIITLNMHGAAIGVPDDCGIKILPTTQNETVINIANAIQKLQHNTLLRTQCGLNAYNYSKQHTWKNRVQMVTSKFYSALMLVPQYVVVSQVMDGVGL